MFGCCTKKFLVLALLPVLFFLSPAFAEVADSNSQAPDLFALCGDVDFDGKITISDIRAVLDGIRGRNHVPPLSDFNGDGRVDYRDFRVLYFAWRKNTPISSCDDADYQNGDANGDGKITRADYSFAWRCFYKDLDQCPNASVEIAEGALNNCHKDRHGFLSCMQGKELATEFNILSCGLDNFYGWGTQICGEAVSGGVFKEFDDRCEMQKTNFINENELPNSDSLQYEFHKVGECPQQQCYCPAFYSPVCVRDGTEFLEFGNACEATCAGLEDKIVADEICCLNENGKPDFTDVCAVQNGKKRQYDNTCAAEEAGADVLYKGQCKPDPDPVCEYGTTPVCGFDNKTYANECKAIEATGKPSKFNAACETPNAAYTNWPWQLTGKVCGIDGNTYDSLYKASLAGVQVARMGTCVAAVFCPTHVSKVCGANNITYNNECLAKMAGTTVKYIGTCGIGVGVCYVDTQPQCAPSQITYDQPSSKCDLINDGWSSKVVRYGSCKVETRWHSTFKFSCPAIFEPSCVHNNKVKAFGFNRCALDSAVREKYGTGIGDGFWILPAHVCHENATIKALPTVAGLESVYPYGVIRLWSRSLSAAAVLSFVI